MIISVDAEKAFNKIPYSFMINTLSKFCKEGMYLKIIKIMHDKPMSHWVEKSWKRFPLCVYGLNCLLGSLPLHLKNFLSVFFAKWLYWKQLVSVFVYLGSFTLLLLWMMVFMNRGFWVDSCCFFSLWVLGLRYPIAFRPPLSSQRNQLTFILWFLFKWRIAFLCCF